MGGVGEPPSVRGDVRERVTPRPLWDHGDSFESFHGGRLVAEAAAAWTGPFSWFVERQGHGRPQKQTVDAGAARTAGRYRTPDDDLDRPLGAQPGEAFPVGELAADVAVASHRRESERG